MHKKQGDKDRVMYRDSLQNYPIDTGEEVILADTGLPAGTPEENPDETSAVYTGKDICSYKEAFAALAMSPRQVTKMLLTTSMQTIPVSPGPSPIPGSM